MSQYIDLVKNIYDNGRVKSDRTGTGTVSIFGAQLRFDLSQGFPVVTEKFTFMRGVIHELLWMIKGDTNIQYLLDNGIHIWDSWAKQDNTFSSDLESRQVIKVDPVILPYSDFHDPVMDVGNVDGHLRALLESVWAGMMRRCYVKKSDNYRFYGGRKVFVAARWHRFSTFVEDVQKLPNWDNKVREPGGFQLDKDYYGSNCYSPETCVWLSNDENHAYAGSVALAAITPEGERKIFPSLAYGARALGMSTSSAHRFARAAESPTILKGNNKQFKGWKFIVLPENYRFRFARKGDLGPVYGKQWRAWPNYRAGESVELTLAQRIELFREKHKNSPTAVLRRDVGIHGAVSDEDTHAELDGRGIPKTRNLHGTIDQLAEAIDLLKNKPNSRRIIVSAWNPADNPDESIPPHVNAENGFAALNSCHSFFQFMAEPLSLAERMKFDKSMFPVFPADDRELDKLIRDRGYEAYVDAIIPSLNSKDIEIIEAALDFRETPRYRLSCQLYQRSADVALGVPFNIASYALLTCMVAQVVNMVPGDFVHTFGDAHLYLNHLSPNGKHPGTAKEGADTIEDLLERETKPFPKLLLNPAIKNIDDFKFEDIKIIGYEHSGKMIFPVAV